MMCTSIPFLHTSEQKKTKLRLYVKYSDAPPNCHFRIANASEGLPFPDDTFDYVAQHDAIFTYTEDEWHKAVNELVRVTKPGGWIQLGKKRKIKLSISSSLFFFLFLFLSHSYMSRILF